MSAEFDWTNKSSVVVKRVDAIAVYSNPNGDIVIRQQDSMGEDDHFVAIPPGLLDDLINALVAEKESLENEQQN